MGTGFESLKVKAGFRLSKPGPIASAQEIQRPVFSLLDRAPLYECCSYISYDSLEQLAQERHLEHLSDTVLDEYSEWAE